ncbi:MAG: beta-mannosidase [Saccharofermentanales bacterium]
MKYLNLNGKWELELVGIDCGGSGLNGISADNVRNASPEVPLAAHRTIEAAVPGDIHRDLEKAGIIPDPLYGDNIIECGWVAKQDWNYIKIFNVDDDFAENIVELCFDGIDTFARITLNGHFIGECHNMFNVNRFDISPYLITGENTLCVTMESTYEKMKMLPKSGYMSCFNHERIFIRKPQCHFSWDWAPELLATGIYSNVYLQTFRSLPVRNVFVKPSNDGFVTFLIERPGSNGHTADARMALHVSGPGFSGDYQFPATSDIRQFTLRIDQPRLWWPAGMGDQNLYCYTLNLYENDELISTSEGQFAFRTIQVDETPTADLEKLRFTIKINDIPVFLKGANWVPADIFTGTVDRAKYASLLQLAVQGNMNCLRVWGGGLYEKDEFYDLCDELGILVLQDFMFSCADLPEDYPGFMEEVSAEIVLQIKRLRNHPSIILWSGGNEKPGGIEKEICIGADQFRYLFRGIADHLDGTRPYIESSPWGYEEPGNCLTSGDAHMSSMTAVMSGNAAKFREKLALITAPMLTEIAIMGSSPIENVKKYLPVSKLWPPNDIWVLHTRGNPYDGTGENFTTQQKRLAEQHFGCTIDSLEDFAKLTAIVQSEHIKADVEFHRSREFDCSGALLWMFNDIWPCGSWSIIDYYLTKKAGYYSMKRACRSLMPLITYHTDGYKAFVSNETRIPVSGKVKIIQQRTDGTTVHYKEYVDLSVPANSRIMVDSLDGFDLDLPDSMFFIELSYEGASVLNSFISHPFACMKFIRKPIEITDFIQSGNDYSIAVRSDAIARVVYLKAEGVDFDDNYFDLQAGMEYPVTFHSERKITPADLTILTFNDVWG